MQSWPRTHLGLITCKYWPLKVNCGALPLNCNTRRIYCLLSAPALSEVSHGVTPVDRFPLSAVDVNLPASAQRKAMKYSPAVTPLVNQNIGQVYGTINWLGRELSGKTDHQDNNTSLEPAVCKSNKCILILILQIPIGKRLSDIVLCA